MNKYKVTYINYSQQVATEIRTAYDMQGLANLYSGQVVLRIELIESVNVEDLTDV